MSLLNNQAKPVFIFVRVKNTIKIIIYSFKNKYVFFTEIYNMLIQYLLIQFMLGFLQQYFLKYWLFIIMLIRNK